MDYRRTFDFWRTSAPVPASYEAIKDIRKYNQQIITISKQFDIDPFVIAGIIYTEASLNRNPANYFEEYYVRTFLLTKTNAELNAELEYTKQKIDVQNLSNINGHSIEFKSNHELTWSLGIGQVSILTANDIEKELHIFERRQRRSLKEVLEVLLDPEENLKYCAFELLRAKTIYYKVTGFNIDEKPDILATLYNIGNVEKVALRALANGQAPTPNAFGKYMMEHASEIRQALYETSSPSEHL